MLYHFMCFLLGSRRHGPDGAAEGTVGEGKAAQDGGAAALEGDSGLENPLWGCLGGFNPRTDPARLQAGNRARDLRRSARPASV